ncbi:MAG: helix-hairpin-helix domain-containing protein, partial [Thermoplasmatota archaeon]
MNEVLNRLKRVRYIGNQTAKILYEREGVEGVEGLLELSQERLKDVHGIGDHKAKLILESARELLDKLEKCDHCGYYSEQSHECPYCEGSVNDRSEDSIVGTFIKNKSQLEHPVGKGNQFYNKISDMIDRQSKGYDVGESLVNIFVNTRKKKRELDQKLRGIKLRLDDLEEEKYVYSSHLESINLLLDKVEKLEEIGRYHACFEVLEDLEEGIDLIGSVGQSIYELNETVESLDEDKFKLDLDSHLYRLEKIYSIGKFEDAKGYVDYLIRSIEENGGRGEVSQSSRRSKSGNLNGYPKPQEEGFINGLENGSVADSKSEEEKGFINGLENGSNASSQHENEKGFINGLRKEKRSLERRLKWKKTAVSALVFFLIIGILLGSAYFFIYEEPDEGIIIDGEFGDWEDVDRVEIDLVGISSSANIIECAVERSHDRLNYYFKTEVDALVGGSDKRMDAVYIFIQTGDGNNFYRTGELEAHYMVKIQGWGDSVYGQLYRYENETLDNNWFGWTHLAGLEIEKSGNEVEFSFPEMYVKDHEVHSQLIALDHTGVQREADHLISPDKPSLTVHQSGLDKEVLGDDDIVSEMIFRSAEGPVTVESIEFEGLEYFESISFEPELDFPIELGSEEEFEVSVMGVPAIEAGDKVRLEVVDVNSDAVNRVVGSGASYYFREVPEEVVIDGAFGDWIEYEEAPSEDVPDRIDIQRYGLQTYDNDAYFMLSTSGNILEGTAIPEGVERYVEERIDSDGDGIPDEDDPYPNDFTNDGIPDSEMVTEDSLPDVDGEGVADWPYGPDKWLNTTIPEDPEIPERYWGREVSRYIGPRPDPLLTGDDMIEVYLDSGSREGYDIMGSRADHRIRFKGQYGEVREFEVQSWVEGRWVGTEPDIDFALSDSMMEFSCAGFEGMIDGFEVIFVTRDWSTDYDTARLDTYGRTGNFVLTGTDTIQNFYLRDNDVLLTERGADESIVNLVNKDGGREHGWMFEEFAGDFEITGDMEALLYLDPTTIGDNRPGVRLTLSTGSGVISQGERDGLSSEGWFTIPLDMDYHKVPKDESITLTTSIMGPEDTESLELDIYYNSHERASRLNVPTNTTINLVDVETFDVDGESQDVFEGGDKVEVRSNVTHAIDADLIHRSQVTVYYPDGSVLLEDEMVVYDGDSQNPPFYSIFNYSFVLEDDTPSGSYEVRVNARDNQDNTDTWTTFFSVPDDPGVSVYPDEHEIGDPGGNVNFTVNVKNIGNVDDSYSLEPGESSRGWTTNLYHDGYLIAEDIGGTGEWDWIDASWDSDGKLDVYVEESQEKTFVVEKVVPEDTEGLTDETKLQAFSMNFTDVSDDSLLKTEMPLTEEMKTFYLLNDDILNTFPGDETVETTINSDESNVWVQDPPMAEDFSLIDSA